MSRELKRLYSQIKMSTCERLLVKLALTDDIYEELKDKETKAGGTLADCIRTGGENPEIPGSGVRACDPMAYVTFAPLFDRIVKMYHHIDIVKQPACDFGDLHNLDLDLKGIDPDGFFIKSTRVRVARSLYDNGYHPVQSQMERIKLEDKIVKVLHQLQGDLKGDYLPLVGMTQDTQEQLVREHYLFNNTNPVNKSAGVYNDWPWGRGIFMNTNRTFVVWIGEEDHIRVISMQPDNDLKAVYMRIIESLTALENLGLNWIRNDRLGYVTYCPTNLGTTMRASVHVYIPMLSQSAHFHEFCTKHHLDIRGTDGHGTASTGSVYDISNKRRMGLTEIEAVREMQEGVKAVIEEEKRLQGIEAVNED